MVNMELSLVAQFDELRRSCDVLRDGTAEVEFLRFVQLQDECRMQWLKSIEEAQRLQRELDNALRSITNLESKLFHARKLLETETKARKHAENERDQIEGKLQDVCEIVRNEHTLRDVTRERLAAEFERVPRRRSRHGHVHSLSQHPEMSAGMDNDINSTGSFLVDLSLTQSEDDFLEPLKSQAKRKSWKKHRPSYNNNGSFKIPQEPPKPAKTMEINSTATTTTTMEPRGLGEIIAHAKVTVPTGTDGGPILAESTFRAAPPPQNHTQSASCASSNSTAATVVNVMPATPNEKPELKKTIIQRQHDLATKTYITSDTCNQCQERIRFGYNGLKCRECKATFHLYCREKISFPCVPQSQTKNGRRGTASTAATANAPGTPLASGVSQFTLEDFCPSSSPRIPALIVHCVSEIENRGLTEEGLYRVGASEREVRALKEKFLRGKTIPALGQNDVHVLCLCVKDFLRTLREPLIPVSFLPEFKNYATANAEGGIKHRNLDQLCQLIERMPGPNRDTLAFLMLHFQRVAQSERTKMSIDNLARVFAPTIVGYSRADLDLNEMCAETFIQFIILQSMLHISTDYWSRFIMLQSTKEPAVDANIRGANVAGAASCPRRLIADGTTGPSATTLDKERRFETPILRRPRKDRKYYATPPYKTSKD